MLNIQQNIINIKNKIRNYEMRYARDANSVILLAASKTQSIENIQLAIDAGQTVFG